MQENHLWIRRKTKQLLTRIIRQSRCSCCVISPLTAYTVLANPFESVDPDLKDVLRRHAQWASEFDVPFEGDYALCLLICLCLISTCIYSIICTRCAIYFHDGSRPTIFCAIFAIDVIAFDSGMLSAFALFKCSVVDLLQYTGLVFVFDLHERGFLSMLPRRLMTRALLMLSQSTNDTIDSLV